jgi:hypothetical protein
VTPLTPEKQQRVARLIADLDSDTFEVREKATTELKDLGEAVTADLRRALAHAPSLEAARRIEGLLGKPDKQGGRPKLTRELAAVLVLEYAGTPEAKEWLKELARGTAGARLTQEAKAALGRLEGTTP